MTRCSGVLIFRFVVSSTDPSLLIKTGGEIEKKIRKKKPFWETSKEGDDSDEQNEIKL
jgi:hypothetical protein